VVGYGCVTQTQILKELEKSKMLVQTGMFANPRGTVSEIVNGIRPHASQILLGDESFFLESDASELGLNDNYSHLMQPVKELWQVLDGKNKDRIKNKLRVLLMLGVIAIRDESLRQIIN